MSRISNSHNVSIVTAASTAIGTLAQSMSAGTWAELTGVSNIFNGIANTGKASGHYLSYGNAAVWNPANKTINIVGGDHDGSDTNWLHHCIYTEATNTWANPVWPIFASSYGHAYDHLCVRPDNGDLYWRHFNDDTYEVARKTLAGSWTEMTGEIATNLYVNSPGCGVAWWTGSLTGIGASGCLLIANESESGEIVYYDPLNSTWGRISNAGGPGNPDYHGLIEYSATKNCAIFGGSNQAGTVVRRLNSDKTTTVLTPFTPRWGINRGNCVADPVTGNFLIRTSGTAGFYEYNPSGSGSYRQLTGSSAAPASLGITAQDPSNLMSCAIPEYGVVVYITAGSSVGACHMHLYKHA